MSDRVPPFEGRRAPALRAELLRRATTMMSGDDQIRAPGETAAAILGVAARIAEEVTRRIDRIPHKQADNLLAAMGIAPSPARPARLPVAFQLSDPAPHGLVAPAATRLMATGTSGAIAFETEAAIALTPGAIAALVGIDAEGDRIFLPPAGPTVNAQQEPPIARTLAGGAGPGADKLQISPVTGLAAGTTLRIGEGPDAVQHKIAEVKGDLIMIDPPLDRTFEINTPIELITEFQPFAARDVQSHALYLGHDTLLNVPSELSITVQGVSLDEATEWSWWGGDPARWQPLVPTVAGASLILDKKEGQPVAREINGHKSLWLRARLPAHPDRYRVARDIRLSVGGSGAGPKAKIVEAIANTTPLVLNSAFHPFGQEPRLFDSFYIGCAEAFSKAGARATLTFKVAGPELESLAIVAGGGLVQVFGVGEDGLLYRAQFGKDQPRLVAIDLRRGGPAKVAAPPARSRVAARLIANRVHVAIAGGATVYWAALPFTDPLDAASLDWRTAPGEQIRPGEDDPIAIVEQDGKPVVLAQLSDGVLVWTDSGEEKPTRVIKDCKLVPIDGLGAGLLRGPVGPNGSRSFSFLDTEGKRLTPRGADLPEVKLAAWFPPGVATQSKEAKVYLAGYASDGTSLRIAKIDLKSGGAEILEPRVDPPLSGSPPIAFGPPPAPLDPLDPNSWPTLVFASEMPVRLVWDGNAYMRVDAPPSIGTRKDVHRGIVASPGWIAVPHGNLGLLYRPGGAKGEWTDEFLLSGNRVAMVDDLPAGQIYAAPDWQPHGNGFTISRSAGGTGALLRGPDTPMLATACFFTDDAGRKQGRVFFDKKGVRLVDEEKFSAWDQARAKVQPLNDAATELGKKIGPLEKAAQDAAAQDAAAQGINDQDKRALDAARSSAAPGAATKERQQAEAELARLQALKQAQEDAARAAAPPPPAPAPTPADTNDKAKPDSHAAAPPASGTASGGTEAHVTQQQIDDAEAEVTRTRAAEQKAKDDAEGKVKAAEEKWNASTQERATLKEAEAKAKAALTAARADLAAKQAERDQAVKDADQAEAYSAAVGDNSIVIRLFYAGEAQDARALWTLAQASDPQWRVLPAKFPPAPSTPGALRYAILSRETERALTPAIAIDNVAALTAAAAKLPPDKPFRFASGVAFDAGRIQRFAGPSGTEIGAIAVPPGSFTDRLAELLTTDPEAWRMLGPVQPPNPALSWEYWNGTSWWALDAANMTDATSNLLAEGDISFTVPEDIGKSDVGGRENYWIRARLVGGDYGEAQVTVSSVTVAGVTRQTVERDVSTIRAPYVTSFDVRFRVDDAVQPRVVLTEDNLGMVDQTQANMVGLPIPVFTPLRDLMNSGAPPAAPVSRALMIGIDKPVWGDPVSLYVDVAPGRAGSELVAEVYRGERFEPVQVRDDSHGLSEPGLIQLSLPVSPDQAELFGRTACWLRFRPRGSPPDWSPRIRAVHSNAVYARSVETRELETLGRSAGTSDQRFALAGSPVESGSLDLRVAEAVGDEEADVLDAAATGAANPGPWARWDQIDDIDDAEGPARVFMLDADAGVVRFGDGRHGAIPPIGAELLALRYRCVAGAAANEVAAGAALLLSSPLTNIERVTALDDAAGGGDRESIEAARRRGAAKLRHGGRILTLADLEDHARDSSTRPAQVRAENLDRGVRLVVAARGADPRPAPAQLRAFERAIREAAGYGIARPGGVTVIAPRLLPLRVTLTLAPDDPGRFIELADAARSALVALFDPATGGLDRQGWRIGRAPAASDLAAALDPLAERGSVSIGALMRGDRSEPTIFPSTVPSDVLVRLDPSDIDCKRREDITA